jgi:hypothetical protein
MVKMYWSLDHLQASAIERSKGEPYSAAVTWAYAMALPNKGVRPDRDLQVTDVYM